MDHTDSQHDSSRHDSSYTTPYSNRAHHRTQSSPQHISRIVTWWWHKLDVVEVGDADVAALAKLNYNLGITTVLATVSEQNGWIALVPHYFWKLHWLLRHRIAAMLIRFSSVVLMSDFLCARFKLFSMSSDILRDNVPIPYWNESHCFKGSKTNDVAPVKHQRCSLCRGTWW